ncbi:MAG: phospholipase [Planctomycetes bacterium]|nr:phospholipase [Planctomycetota bacterium]
MGATEFISDRAIYKKVLLERVPEAKSFLWIGTSDLKDLHVDKNGRMVPFLEVLSDLVKRNVSIRLIHAKEPGENFREDFDRYPNLIGGMERILCPRVHFKSVVVDGEFAYTGSANLTGAGMGAKGKTRRNFESGIITTEQGMIEKIMEQFDGVWMGKHCRICGRKKYCADYKDMLSA